MIRSPEYIRSIKPYIPGKPVEELEREFGIHDPVKLASNENPLGPSNRALQAIRKTLAVLNRYPEGDCYYLRQELSGFLNVTPGEILFGNGSNELIELAVRTFLRPGEEAVMAAFTFPVYPMAVQAAGGRSIAVPLRNWRHDLERMASKVTAKTRIVFIANPNNPTGTYCTDQELKVFMENVPGHVLVVVDEAYYEYVTATDYADSFTCFRQGKNVLILRTFSKIYGLAGLRIGYAVAQPSIISDMNRVRQPFNVNTLAQIAARSALNDSDHISRSRKANERGKRYLYRVFDKMGVRYVPSETNFIYIDLDADDAPGLYESLLRKGIIVRPVGPRGLRVTIGRMKENKQFAEAFTQLYNQT